VANEVDSTSQPRRREGVDTLSGGISHKVLALFWGMAVGALLFGMAGAVSDRFWIGIVIGALLGALVVYGITKHWFGPIVVWVTVFAVVALIETGCDVNPVVCIVSGAVLGTFIGAMGWWRGTLAVCAMWIGGVVGFVVGGDCIASPAICATGAATGLSLAWLVGYVMFPRKRGSNAGVESE
jgi:hypothetical protein